MDIISASVMYHMLSVADRSTADGSGQKDDKELIVAHFEEVKFPSTSYVI